MAKNDAVLLDGILDEQISQRGGTTDRGEAFERFSLEQLLKDYDLSSDDLDSGWTDGRDDGGIDAFFTFVNGVILDDAEEFPWPKSHAVVDVWLISCKHHDTFKQATLDALLASLPELLDLGRSRDDLKGAYSADLLEQRDTFAMAYRKLSIGRPAVRFHIAYASRGDSSSVGDSVRARAAQIESTIAGLFSSCSASFAFVGATELVELHRRGKRFTLELPFRELLAGNRESYVLLAQLPDYHRFVSEESGSLRRYLFDSNIRDYLGITGPNKDIATSLETRDGPEFWWLNNGVTILATSAAVVGKAIQLENVQIVNGLQTSESIHSFFAPQTSATDDRSVLVKVVVSSDPAARDAIIRATNNQNPVDITALHATDKIQRDIEAILEKYEWYYERRKNYYRFVGKPAARFVTPTYVAAAAVTLVHRLPKTAANLRPKFMRHEERYDAVFSEDLPLEVWPRLVAVFKATDETLLQVARPPRKHERFLRTWRPLVGLIAVARRFGTFDYSLGQLQSLPTDKPLSSQEINDSWSVIRTVLDQPRPMDPHPTSFAQRCCDEAAKKFGIGGAETIGRRSLLAGPAMPRRAAPPTPEFVGAVNELLPDQPWKPGVHREVAKKLQCPPKLVTTAINQLIAEGRRHNQTDGVVYATDGSVIGVDSSRSKAAPSARIASATST